VKLIHIVIPGLILTASNTQPTTNNLKVGTFLEPNISINKLDNATVAEVNKLNVSAIGHLTIEPMISAGDALLNYAKKFSLTNTDSLQYSVNDGSVSAVTTGPVAVDFKHDEFKNIPLVSGITGVQPMTGIVLWASSHNNSLLKTSNRYTQLEYAYLNPARTVIGEGLYDWSSLENLLEQVSSRAKQMVVRFAYVLPGKQTRVPDHIKSLPDYNETSGITEGQLTHFPDWSNQVLQKAHLDLYSAFAARYDDDPRIAFLQVGFGLWSEYHIYQPGVQLGINFPSKEYQTAFLKHLDSVFNTLQWSISIDAGVESVTPLLENQSLMSLDFGLFDDSFMHKAHSDYNEIMLNQFNYAQRYKQSVLGGEFSYYTQYDQQHALDIEGIHGYTFAEQSAKFHISYMIGNDQPDYQSNKRIRDAGLSSGYRFKITSFKASSNESRVTVKNIGVAPIYYDAYVAVNKVAAKSSLKGLLPEASAEFTVASGGVKPVLSIESDRLVDGQRIEFEANL